MHVKLQHSSQVFLAAICGVLALTYQVSAFTGNPRNKSALYEVAASHSDSASAPQNLSVQAGLYGGAVLRWDSTSGALGYVIYKSIDGSSYRHIALVERREFVDWYVYPGHDYHYYVTSLNGIGESNPSDAVEFALEHPPAPSIHGVITGTVLDDSTGLPIREAVIQFFKPSGLWSVRTHTDSSGNYWAPLDTGSYFIEALRYGYRSEWYNDEPRVEHAWVVNLHQDTVTADFGLQPIPVIARVTVSGTVTDSVSGLPLPNAYIAFLRPPRWLKEVENETGYFGGFPDERIELSELGFLHGVVELGRTDSLGNYHTSTLGGLPLIAVAFKPGFIPRFYDNKPTPFDADRLLFVHDTGGIDFQLLRNPLSANSLSGMVRDSSGAGIPSSVILVRKTPHDLFPVRFRMTDSVGNYTFYHLPAGIYLVKAVPVTNFAPAWHNVFHCGVRDWHNADTVQVGSDVTGIDVCVAPSAGSGFARITGDINKSSGPSLNKSLKSASTSAAGVSVYAVSPESQSIVSSDITENDGTFALENLPAGSYQIVIDKEGFSAANTPGYTVDQTNDYQVTASSIMISPDAPLSVGDGGHALPNEYRLEQNFPNPFNPTTEIRFSLPTPSSVSVKIYNVIGQLVVTLANDVFAAGVQRIQWHAREGSGNAASSGIYFVKLTASPVDGSRAPFVQVRKMILLE